LSGVADAAPIDLGHLIGGRSSPHIQLIEPFVFLPLVADVVPNHCLVAAYRGHEIPTRPETLPGVILLPFPVYPRKMNRALALDEPNHRRHRILERNRDHHVHMVGLKMPFLDAALLLLGQSSEHLAQMLVQASVQHLPAAFRNENDVVPALPFRVA